MSFLPLYFLQEICYFYVKVGEGPLRAWRHCMDKLFGNWFSGGGFTAWKLHTWQDYLNFGLVVLAGILVFVLAQRRINKHRNYQDSCARVAKRLKQLGGPGAECYLDVTVHSKRDVQPCGFLHVSGNCVYAVKVFWWGLDVTGSADAKRWAFTASKDVRYEPNPLPELEETCVALNRLFVRRGLTGVPVKPLVVLADNFGSSHIHITGADCVLAYQDLKKWRKAYPLDKKKGFDIAAVKAALEASFADAPSEK